MTDPKKKDPETTELDTSKHVSPNEDASNEPTPIGDEIAEELNGDDAEEELPFAAKAYKVDVQQALERETQDGPGDEDPGLSNWQGYATDEVEKED